MPGTSSKTKPIALRLSNEVYAILEHRIVKNPLKWARVSDYIKDRIIYDALRKR